MRTKDLHAAALNIEFLVISVIQGMALQMLAGYSMHVITTYQFEYWPYITSGFMLILIFWSQSILHALSFIRWPIDLLHTFLYFLASFIEVMAFSQVADPRNWFLFGSLFVLSIGMLYAYDFYMIKKSRKHFISGTHQKHLFNHIYRYHQREMKFLVPAALFFNTAAFLLLYQNSELFIEQKYHVLIGGLQSLSSLVILIASLGLFKERLSLLAKVST
ncbi:hypothetical protein HY469_04250 [Candidatus Roizmanbacteria bacterium]|nr:hypothetical protein [Candidatus Roizmanbacteria bacterium]